MPLTRFPNGLTTNSTTALQYSTAASDGDLDCRNLFIAGTSSLAGNLISAGTMSAGGAVISGLGITMSTATNRVFIGERAYLQFTFTSAANTAGLITVPFNGQLIDCWVSADVSARVCSAFTLYTAGSASGTVAVASVELTFATAIGQQVQPTLTPAAVTTATAMAFVVTTAGTACNFYGVAVIQRTA